MPGQLVSELLVRDGKKESQVPPPAPAAAAAAQLSSASVICFGNRKNVFGILIRATKTRLAGSRTANQMQTCFASSAKTKSSFEIATKLKIKLSFN